MKHPPAREHTLAAAPARPSVEEDIRDLTVRRLEIGAWLTLPFVAIFALSDVVFAAPPVVSFLLGLKLLPIVACTLALLAGRVRWLRERVERLALFCVLSLGLTQFLSTLADREVWSLPIMMTSLGLTASVYLPWGAAAQAIASAGLFAMSVAAMVAVLGPSGLATAGAIGSLFGMLIVLGNSPVVAATIRSLIFRNSEIDNAKAELGDILSRRLEEANRKLEKRGIALEQALEEAERANLSKTRFLANISHEFRTPLTSIVGFASMLRNGAAGPVSGKQLDYLTEICTSAEHLLRMVQAILTHARIEAKEDPLQLSDVPVDLLVEVACRQVSPAAVEKEVTIRRSPPSRTHLLADKQKLLQMMLNLLSNAIKFSSPKSEIGTSVRDLGDGVEIAVWDAGIGIAPDDLERIFLPFEQVERANRTSQKGTGLGLAICKRIVEEHSGTIRAESTSGAGSRFVVTLPKSPAGARQGQGLRGAA